MRIRVLEIVLVITVALLSWLFMFSLEHYFGGVEGETVLPENKPPFPDHLADNIFWFLQVILQLYTCHVNQVMLKLMTKCLLA